MSILAQAGLLDKARWTGCGGRLANKQPLFASRACPIASVLFVGSGLKVAARYEQSIALAVQLAILPGLACSTEEGTSPAIAALCSCVVGMHQQVVHDQAVLHPPRLHQRRPRSAVEHLPKRLHWLLRMRVQHQETCRSQQASQRKRTWASPILQQAMHDHVKLDHL